MSQVHQPTKEQPGSLQLMPARNTSYDNFLPCTQRETDCHMGLESGTGSTLASPFRRTGGGHLGPWAVGTATVFTTHLYRRPNTYLMRHAQACYSLACCIHLRSPNDGIKYGCTHAVTLHE